MKSVGIKMGIREYNLEYETLDDIKNHFKKDYSVTIGLEALSLYDDRSESKRILVDELSFEDVAWADEYCASGSRYLRGWRN
jgi:hypothetical protein